MKLLRKVGATSEIWQVFVQDSSSTTGAGLTGLVFNSASLTAYYHRDVDTTATVITLVTMTVGTFTSSGFKEIDATNMPGWYQFCPPNAALASGAKSCAFHLKGATNMAPLPIEVDLDGQVDVTHWNGTVVATPATAGIPDVNVKNINNVAAATPGASGGILISGTNSGTTTLGALTCTGSFTISDGLLVSRSSSNTSAITATGNGTGSGIVATSGAGATGDGIQATAASTNGNGFAMTGVGTGNGLKIASVSGDALSAVASTSGHGFTATGAGTTKHGINATGGATTSHGISATGGGVGHGILATSGSGATGDGFRATAASTNGNGFNTLGSGTGAGRLSTGGATGAGLSLVGGATSGDALLTATTSGHGATFAGTGTTKHGINATGGATTSDGIRATGGGAGHGINLVAGGTGNSLKATTTAGDGFSITPSGGHGITIQGSGATKAGINCIGSGGSATGPGMIITTTATNDIGLKISGSGTGQGMSVTGGATGAGMALVGGATSGHGLAVTTTSGDGINLSPTAGHGILATANGTSKHGIVATGGTAGTSDGISCVAGTGGVDLRANITGNLTGTVTTVTTVTNQLTSAQIATGVWQDTVAGDFTVASSIGRSLYTAGVVPGAANGLFIAGTNAATTITTALTTTFTGNLTGSVGSVTGAVGSVTGAVGSVTGNVGGNVVGSVGSVTGAVGSVTGSVGSVAASGITAASFAANAITATVIADAAIDQATFAADTGMQTIRSNTAQAGASTTITLDASASATDSFYVNDLIYLTGGTGAGQARFITAYVGSTKVATVNSAWTTNPDATTTFAILPFDSIPGATAPTAAQVATAVWTDLLASADFSTVSSIGKLLKDDIDATISSRMATYTQPAGFLAATFPSGTIANTTNITAGTITTVTNQLTAAQIATGVWQDAVAGDFTVASSIGRSLYTGGVVPGAANGLFIAGTNAATTITTALTTTFTGNLTGSVGSVTGNVTGSVGSVATGGIVAASFAANAIDATALAASAVTEIQTGLATSAVDISRILDRIDYQRGQHTATGSTFWVDGIGGNDSNPGTRALPKLTITGALALCTNNAHDEIILLPNSAGGPTTITESAAITITKNYVQIRGPGRDVNVTRSNDGGVFDIQASGVELSGFRVTTFGGASSDAVTISNAADFVRLYRLWIENAHRDAIQFNVANRGEVSDCVLVAPARDGVRVSSGAGSGTYNVIIDCVIRDAVGSAVNLQGSDASDCRIQRNILRDNAVGITIASGVLDTVFTDNRLLNNATTISDAGTNTLQQWNFFNTNTAGAIVALATDAVNAAALAADAVTEIQSGLATSAALATVQADTDNIQTRLPASLISGRMDSNVQATAAALVFDLTGNITGNLSGSVGSVTGNVNGNIVGSVASVTGSVGSVTGNVGGNVVGSVASVTGAVGSVTATVNSTLVAAGIDNIVIETGLNARQALSLIVAAESGQVSGATGGATTIVIKGSGVPATTRISATVDGFGNRTALVLTPPA